MKSRDKILLGGLALLLAVVGWLVFEHYHLKNKVEQFKRERIAKGDRFITSELAPSAPPYEINGGASFLDILTRIGSLSNQPYAMTFVARGKARIAWQQAEPRAPDFINLWEYLAMELKDNRPLLDELCQVLGTNQVLDFRPNYAAAGTMLLSHLSHIKTSAQILCAATLMDMHERNFSSAYSHLLAGSLLIKRYHNEPMLISQLVRMACFEIVLGETWEAMHGGLWNDAQWQELQQVWETTSVLPIWVDTFRMESALACDYFQQMRKDPSFLGFNSSLPTNLVEVMEQLYSEPEEGWKSIKHLTKWRYWSSYADELHTLQKWAVAVDSQREAMKQNSLQPLKIALEDFAKQYPNQPRDDFAAMFISDDDSELRLVLKMGGFETRRMMLVTAIALKRHHIKHKKYPANLAEMVPEFLSSEPVDFMDGKPLRYGLNPDGTFQLYSVGDDGLDQGGSTEPAEASSTSFNWHRAKDWVWPQPATAAEVQQYVESKQKRKKK